MLLLDFSKNNVILMCPFSPNVYARARKEEAAIQQPEYSAKPRIQKPNILEAIPVRINDATNIRKIAAI